LRCPRCGNENADTNRFCGMCGASLVSAAPASAPAKDAKTSQAAVQASRTVSTGSSTLTSKSTSAVVSAVPPPREPLPQRDKIPEVGITGPSFLGLNDSPRQSETRPRVQGAQDQLQSSHSVDYLLEDDEEEPKRGWGKVLVVLVALGLALGFGYLHWKQGGFDWVTGSANKPQTTAPSVPPGAPSAATTPAPPSTSTGSISDQTATSSAPAAATPPANSNQAPSLANSANGAQSNASQPAPANSAENTSSNGASSQPTKSESPPQAAGAPNAVAQNNDKSESESGDSDSAAVPATKALAPKPQAPKPSAAVPVSLVTEAERYIYGRGVRQDCDHGFRLLKRAAESDPKAMTAMGTLYSTGTCAPRDLPTAYRWYALALHKEPDNQTLQNDLQKLWSQMTQPERQLAIRLSQ
jgi:hypothetical protein